MVYKTKLLLEMVNMRQFLQVRTVGGLRWARTHSGHGTGNMLMVTAKIVLAERKKLLSFTPLASLTRPLPRHIWLY